MLNIVNKLFGSASKRHLKSFSKTIVKINEFEACITETYLTKNYSAKTVYFRKLISEGLKLPLMNILPEVFAVVREVSRRTINLRHFDVQLQGGIVLHKGMIAEMKTGEGKTLVATLTAYLNSLKWRSCSYCNC